MGKQSIHLETLSHQKAHREKLLRKKQKIEMLNALIEEHEAQDEPDFEYVQELKRRLRSVEHQLSAMLP